MADGRTYLGWIQLMARYEGVFGDLLAGAAAEEPAEYVKAVHAYPVREVCAIISAGRPTEVGLRRYPAVQTIIATGADNQRSARLDRLRRRT